jgi:hypothetical protein
MDETAARLRPLPSDVARGCLHDRAFCWCVTRVQRARPRQQDTINPRAPRAAARRHGRHSTAPPHRREAPAPRGRARTGESGRLGPPCHRPEEVRYSRTGKVRRRQTVPTGAASGLGASVLRETPQCPVVRVAAPPVLLAPVPRLPVSRALRTCKRPTPHRPSVAAAGSDGRACRATERAKSSQTLQPSQRAPCPPAARMRPAGAAPPSSRTSCAPACAGLQACSRSTLRCGWVRGRRGL